MPFLKARVIASRNGNREPQCGERKIKGNFSFIFYLTFLKKQNAYFLTFQKYKSQRQK